MVPSFGLYPVRSLAQNFELYEYRIVPASITHHCGQVKPRVANSAWNRGDAVPPAGDGRGAGGPREARSGSALN